MSSCLDGCSTSPFEAKNSSLVWEPDDDCRSVPAESQAGSIEPRIQQMVMAMAQQAIDRIRARMPADASAEMQAALSQISSAMLAGSAQAFGKLVSHLSQLESCQNLPLDLINSIWAGAGIDVCLSRVDNQIVIHNRDNPQRGIVFDPENGGFYLSRLRQTGGELALGARIGGEAEAQRHFNEMSVVQLRALTTDGRSEVPAETDTVLAANDAAESAVPRGQEWIHRWANSFNPLATGDGFVQRQMMELLLRNVSRNNASLVDVLRRLNEAGANLRIAATTPTEDNPHEAVLVWRATGGREVRVPINQPIT